MIVASVPAQVIRTAEASQVVVSRSTLRKLSGPAAHDLVIARAAKRTDKVTPLRDPRCRPHHEINENLEEGGVTFAKRLGPIQHATCTRGDGRTGV